MRTNSKNKQLCLSLMKADSEDEVIKLLSEAGFWDDDKAWRYYGDRSTNYNAVGNQSSKADVAIVEKIINSVDARLLVECRTRGIDPESPEAPGSIREAVASFFESDSHSATAGIVREWQPQKRTRISRGITVAATGYKPKQGRPCFTISDCGEGQSPKSMPDTILSLDRENKVKINFVQGKYNMGGSGVLEFCGDHSLQLVVSKRAPELVSENTNDPTEGDWGFTVVRREDPVGGRRNSVFTYLAPIGSNTQPRRGEVLSFSVKTMPIFPKGNKAYDRHSPHGTLIKLYEYSTEGFSGSHILRRGGLLDKLDIRLANMALPIRLHECRSGYRGGPASFDTTLSGLEVRLDDDRSKNLEDVFSCSMTIDGQQLTGMIYVFKKGKDSAYRGNEGVIFTHNGQTHGHLSKAYYGRNKMNMGYLKNSILVIINCDQIEARPREKLFMPRRDTLRNVPLRRKIEEELGLILQSHPELRALRERRRREEMGKALEGSKPLQTILVSLIKQSPGIAALLNPGLRLPIPFKTVQTGESDERFAGKRYPTFFKFKGLDYGEVLTRNCHINVRGRINFETDAVSDYFSRAIHCGTNEIFLVTNGKKNRVPNKTFNLANGIATLNLELPNGCRAGDKLRYIVQVMDNSRVDPFINEFVLNIEKPMKKTSTKSRQERKPASDKKGKEREKSASIDLPTIKKVFEKLQEDEKCWEDMDPPFDKFSALRVIPVGSLDGTKEDISTAYDFYINMDNEYLKLDMKHSKNEPDLICTRFVNGLVLFGIAMLHHKRVMENKSDDNKDDTAENDVESIDDKIEETSKAIASVLLPMIEGLSKLTAEELASDEVSEESD